MSRLQLEALRGGMRLNPIGKVRLAFELKGWEGNGTPVVGFECVTCLETMEWSPLREWWDCGTCGYELTAKEAEIVIRDAQIQIKRLASNVREKSGRWDLRTWLKQLLPWKAASKTLSS